MAGQNDPVPEALGDFTDDDVLVPALRRGDENAFGWLLDQYSTPLLHLARVYVSNAEAAHEVVQETWVGVITGVDGFEQRSSLKTWIYRILMNVARSKGVKERRSLPFTSLTAELDNDERAVDPDRFRGPREHWPGHWASPPVRWDEEPEDHPIGRETLSVISTAIGLLPPNQQTVITLRDVEGWAADEVCNALEISETNQRVLLHRATIEGAPGARGPLRGSCRMIFNKLLLRLIRDYPCAQLVEAVTEYLEGTMPASERRRFERHLKGCPGCQIYVEQFRRTIEQSGRITMDDVEALPAPARAELLETFRAFRSMR